MYTPLDWDTSNKEKNSSDIFVFSLSKKLISYCRPQSYRGMYCLSDTGTCSEYIGFQNNNGMTFVLIYNSNDIFYEVYKFGIKEGRHDNKEVEVFSIIIEK